MHFAAAFCAAVTKQRGKQLLAWWHKQTGSDPNEIIWTQSSGGRGRGEQTNSGSDQAIEPSVKAL